MPPAVTVTSTEPALPAGLVALQLVAELQVTAVAATVPKLTVEALVEKPDPVMVTTVLPASGPEFGATLVTVGGVAAEAVTLSSPKSRLAMRRTPPANWEARHKSAPLANVLEFLVKR